MKHFIITTAVLFFGMCHCINADTSLLTTENGWQKITVLPDNLDDYYFAFVDNTRNLMLGLGSGTSGKQGSSYQTMIYYNCVDPLNDKTRLWTIEKIKNVTGYENKYAIRNAKLNSFVLTGSDNYAIYRIGTETEPTAYSAVNIFYSNNSYWLIQNGKVEGNNYLGPWNGGEFTDGMEIALNKANDGTRAGKFYIYAILKTSYESQTAISECPPLTPAWFLGHIAWEDNYNTQEKTLELIRLYREHDIPVNGVIIDSPWSRSYNDFFWDTNRYPNAAAMSSQLNEWGVKPILWLTGNVNNTSNGTPQNKCDDYDYAVEQGYGINNSQPSSWWKGNGIQIDFTNPEATEWFYNRIDRAFTDGFYGLKVDQGETYFGSNVTTSIGTMSNENFRKYYYNAMYDYVTNRKPGLGAIVARPYSHQGGYHASIGKMSMGWCGDFGGDWSGLKLQINNIYTSSEAGYGAVGTEIAGFMGAKANKNQFIRYTQFGAMTACMINGGENGGFENHLPWWHDEETTNIYRYCVSLHNELIPYIFSTMVDTHLNGGSIIRNVNFNDESHQLGTDIFTKAITSETTNISFTLPSEGEWIDFFRGTHYNAASTVNRNFSYTEFPLFVKAGSIIPMNIRTAVTGIGDISFANRKTLLLYPDGNVNTRILHLPDGEGTEYSDVTVTYDAPNGLLTATSEKSFDYTFVLNEIDRQPSVTGCESWSYNPTKKSLYIKATGKNLSIHINFSDIQTQTLSELLTTDKGYLEISNISDLETKTLAETFLFVIADNNYSNVATSASGKTRGELLMGIGQGPNHSNGAMYNAMVYQTPVDPVKQPSELWIIDNNGDGTYSFRNVSEPEYLFQTDNNSITWRLESQPTVSDKTKLLIKQDGTKGWTFQINRNKTSGSSFIGPWEAGVYDPGMECAANKPATEKNGNLRQGHFRIFSIPVSCLLPDLSGYARSQTVVISAAQWATCILPFSAEKPNGIEHIYTCDNYIENNNSVLALSECDHFSPYTPYIIYGIQNNYELAGIQRNIISGASVRKGWLVGALEKLSISPTEDIDNITYQNYVLQKHDEDVGFYRMASSSNNTILAGRAYLSVPKTTSSNVKTFFLTSIDATDIENIAAKDNTSIIEVYTISGQRIPTLQKGLNIVKTVNGETRKIMVQ